MKSQKGISLISLLLVVIIVFLCIVLFMNIFNKNSKIVGSWEFIYGTSYTFNKDGTGSTNFMNYKKEFTYKINFNKILVTYKDSQATFEAEYSIKGDKLYIGDDIICTKVK